jgi:phosphoribosylformylglycinamidine cyclo-ligase
MPSSLAYSGSYSLTDYVEGSPLNAGKLVLSPTRTYAPVIKKVLDQFRNKIDGMVHCSGGGQTKVLHFAGNVHIVKDNLFPTPPLFVAIQQESKTDWSEMYRVFNMGHRMEIYTDEETAKAIIAIANSFEMEAQIIGRVEESETKKLTIQSAHGNFEYAH